MTLRSRAADQTWKGSRHTALAGLALLAGLGSRPDGAAASELCVICQGPPASYRCGLLPSVVDASQSAKLACITTIARTGQHESCAVSGSRGDDCPGPLVQVEPAPLGLAGRPDTPPALAQDMSPASPPGPATPAEPTLADVLGKATKSTGEGAANAGKSISDGAKKTWRCVTSLFQGC